MRSGSLSAPPSSRHSTPTARMLRIRKSLRRTWAIQETLQVYKSLVLMLASHSSWSSWVLRRSYSRNRKPILILAGVICFIFMICSLRTNIAFFIIFLTLVCGFGCLAGAFFNLALAYENPTNLAAATRASRCIVVSSGSPTAMAALLC